MVKSLECHQFCIHTLLIFFYYFHWQKIYYFLILNTVFFYCCTKTYQNDSALKYIYSELIILTELLIVWDNTVLSLVQLRQKHMRVNGQGILAKSFLEHKIQESSETIFFDIGSFWLRQSCKGTWYFPREAMYAMLTYFKLVTKHFRLI